MLICVVKPPANLFFLLLSTRKSLFTKCLKSLFVLIITVVQTIITQQYQRYCLEIERGAFEVKSCRRLLKRSLPFFITRYLPDFIFLKNQFFDESSKNENFETEKFLFPSSRDMQSFFYISTCNNSM